MTPEYASKKTEKIIGYVFKNKELKMSALTHSSYYNENKYGRPCNERLEFLGDAVLSLVAAEFLYNNDKSSEGDMSRKRAALVCEEALYDYSMKSGLHEFLLVGKGEVKDRRGRTSMFADLMEAVLGAIYLDGGIEEARKFILPYIRARYPELKNLKDFKTLLQEIVQKNKGEKLSYEIVDSKGPAHNTIFVCDVLINSNHIARGQGRSKKQAEQDAAQNALKLMGVEI